MEDVRLYIKDYFKDLTFEEKPHKYFVGTNPIKKSVSDLIKYYSNPFDENVTSVFSAKKLGISKEEVLKIWHDKRDNAIRTGKQAHLFGELYTFNRNLRPQTPYDLAILKFWQSVPDFVIPLFTELQMYHKKRFYAGTADGILLNTRTGKLIIIDYKTNEDLFKNYKGQTFFDPFTNLLDTPFNKYQLQLSYYKILLEQTGYEVSTTKVIWLRPDGEFVNYDTKDLTEYLK